MDLVGPATQRGALTVISSDHVWLASVIHRVKCANEPSTKRLPVGMETLTVRRVDVAELPPWVGAPKADKGGVPALFWRALVSSISARILLTHCWQHKGLKGGGGHVDSYLNVVLFSHSYGPKKSTRCLKQTTLAS